MSETILKHILNANILQLQALLDMCGVLLLVCLFFLFLFCVYIACMHVCLPPVCLVPKRSKIGMRFLELWTVVSHHVHSGNQIQVFCKNVLLTAEHSPQPSCWLVFAKDEAQGLKYASQVPKVQPSFSSPNFQKKSLFLKDHQLYNSIVNIM